MKKILVPCDFSDAAVQAFKFAVEIASQSKGEILLLHVIELPVMHDTVLMPTLNFEQAFLKDMAVGADKNFLKMKEKWAKDGPKVTSFLEYGTTAYTINNFIVDKKVDLVGSNTEKIVRISPVPVFTVKKSVKTSSIKNIAFPNTLEDSAEQDELILG